MTILHGGNVGIGTTTPAEALDVTGDVKLSGDIELGHASDTTIARSAAGAVTIEGKRIVTEDRQRQVTHHMFQADIDTTKYYIGLQEADAENTSQTNKFLPMLAPSAGKLLKIFLRANTDLSGNTLTWTLETKAVHTVTVGTPTTVGTISGAGCNNKSATTYDFDSLVGEDGGDNIIDIHDMVYIAIESNSATSNTKFYVTCVWEWDLSSI